MLVSPRGSTFANFENLRRSWELGGLIALGALALACSDAPPEPSKGGVSYRITSALTGDTPPGYACPVLGHEVGIGAPPPSGQGPGGRSVDGENGATVSCRVSGTSFSASLRKDNVSFSISGSVEDEATGEATLFAFDPKTSGTLTNNPQSTTEAKPCEVSTVGDPYKLGGGGGFLTFNCPGLELSGQPNTFCRISDGYLTLADCD